MWKCERNQQLEMDPMREETKFLLLRRTNEPTPPFPLQPTDSRTDAHADCGAEAGISATASTPTTPEKPTPTPSKSKHSNCHFNIRKKGVFWFDRRHMATPNQNSEVSTNFYGSEINQRNFDYCAFEWEDETTLCANRATPCSYRSVGGTDPGSSAVLQTYFRLGRTPCQNCQGVPLCCRYIWNKSYLTARRTVLLHKLAAAQLVEIRYDMRYDTWYTLLTANGFPLGGSCP